MNDDCSVETAPHNTSNGTVLLLEAVSGLRMEARIIPYEGAFGPEGRYTNTSAQPLVEFRRHGVRPLLSYLNTFPVDYFDAISHDVRFSPDTSLRFAITTAELKRLVEWLQAAFGAADDDELV